MNKIFKISALAAPVLLTSFSAIADDSEKKSPDFKQKFNLEGGITMANGNSDSENLHGKFGLTTIWKDWEHKLEAKASNKKQNDIREEEYYKIDGKLSKELTEDMYGFGQLIYEDDRFAGINYRASELLGLGHKFYDEDDFKLSGEVGAGARQTDYRGNAEDEDSILANLGGDLFWKINDNVEFTQGLDFNFTEKNTETVSETAVKAFMNENLYLKFSYELRNNSDVPAGTKKTDTETIFTVGYQFDNK